ncbi:hypothetical protein [Peribacillus frigoritolerans]|uniref:hypothetical protein n=1 Tax=Peribacillus frigoritolerans TaxID=450367 RepID=UPI0022818A38|nr:hypothetical protein [Peribacillus frigoritolerans]MCY8935960.1 hypothetical protein [Peribacillus frigoritolerans]
MADVKEVFSTDEKALLKKFDRRKGVNQVVSATGKSMSDTKVTIQTYEKKQGEWRRALKKMEGVERLHEEQKRGGWEIPGWNIFLWYGLWKRNEAGRNENGL